VAELLAALFIVSEGLPQAARSEQARTRRGHRAAGISILKGRLHENSNTLLSLIVAVMVGFCLSSCGNQPSHDSVNSEASHAATQGVAGSEAGIRCTRVLRRVLGENISATGQVMPDVGKESDVAPRFSGRIVEVLVKPGDFVKPRQHLAVIDSHEIASLQAELVEGQAKLMIARAHEEREKQVYEENLLRPQSLIHARTEYDHSKVALELAHSEFKRVEGLRKEMIASEKDFLSVKANQAQAELAHTEAAQQLQREEGLYKNKGLLRKELQLAEAETARARQHVDTLKQRLQFVGVHAELVEEVARSGKIVEHIPMHARVAGVITHQDAAVGELIEPSKRIFTITDLSTVVVSVDIPEIDVKWIKIGSPARIKIASYPDKVFQGAVSYISDTVNAETRTVPVKVKLSNTQLLLKTNMFAEIELQGSPRSVIACPRDAVQERDGHTIVFVKEGSEFKPQQVELGSDTEKYYEVISGLHENDEVVTQGSLLLKTELTLKQQ
jgi:RND family efflux transporter MFP subunit